jgi:SAM-dependent methyltransferase
MVEPFDARAVQAAYEVAADAYADAFGNDLDRLPFDCSILDAVAGRLKTGPVLDLGCGPGQIARRFMDRGLEVVGLDSALAILRLAERRIGSHRVARADLRWLPFVSASFAAVVAFYSVHHLPRAALPMALREAHRVLVPDGILVIVTHLGEGDVYVDELLGHEIDTVGAALYGDEELQRMLTRSSSVVERVQHRAPLAHEYPSERIYIICRRDLSASVARLGPLVS